MPRYVLLRHECPPSFGKPSHWDLMLESGGELRTWSLETLPSRDGSAVLARKLPNHRLAYLYYEGPLSGDRGEVARVDSGELTWIDAEPPRLAVLLAGGRLAGRLELCPLKGDEWELRLTPP